MIPHRPLALAGLLLCTGSLAASNAGATSLALLGGRFDVEAAWRTPDGRTGSGTAVALTDETGYFWFFSPTNVEVVVKGLDACAGGTPRFWVFAGGLTDAQVTLLVTDQATGQQKIYRNPQGQAFQPIQDTDAFATCGTPRCGRGGFAELAATPRVNLEAESLALALGGGVTAPQALYERVAADLASIRRQRPDLAGIGFVSRYDPQRLLVTFDLATAATVTTGDYHAWDCLNRWYGLAEQEGPYSGITMSLRFDKVLDVDQLVADYAVLPGVTQVSTGGGLYLPIPTERLPSLCGLVDGDRLHYFLRQPGPPGQPSVVHTFDSEPGAEPHPSSNALSEQCFGTISLY